MVQAKAPNTLQIELASGTYFGLDPVGARIWQLMVEGKALAEVCESMLAEYEVTPERIELDVLALAQDLSAKQLISVA